MINKFYIAVIRPCEDGRYYLFFPDFKGCSTLANNLNDCIEKSDTELNLCIELYTKITNRPLPQPTDYMTIQKQYPNDMLCFVSTNNYATHDS